MSEHDFTYRLPDDFSKRVIQVYIQKDRHDVADSIQKCLIECEDLGLAYYAGVKGDNWNKHAVNIMVEGPETEIKNIQSDISVFKKAVEVAIQSSKSGLVIKDVYFFDSLLSTADTDDLFSESIDLKNCELVGRGGYGDVYKYYNKHLDLNFALKIYSPIYAIETDQLDGEKRFFREAKMLFSLFHEGIIRVYDAGRINKQPFIKMEFIDGQTLYSFHSKMGNLSYKSSIPIIKKITAAVGYAHSQGILHRDLKPSNILIENNTGRVVIIDFGISAFFDIGRHTQLTKAGEAVAGSSYSDPVLLEHPELRDCRSDIYSIGAVWFYLLCGRTPAGSDLEHVLKYSQNEIEDSQIDNIMKCLRTNLEDRYESCDALMQVLNETKTAGDTTIRDIVNVDTVILNATTDDEKIVLYYMLIKKKRHISKVEINNWLNKNEIYDVDVENAFDLLSTIDGGIIVNDSIEIGIQFFRECIMNADQLTQSLEHCVKQHVIHASSTFMKVCTSFDTIEWLFVAYIVDRKMYSYGSRWMSEIQIKDIKEWERNNFLDESLSNNYGRCLEVFIQNSLVHECDWTQYGNPREYSLNESLKLLLSSGKNQLINEKTTEARNKHYGDIPF